MNVHEFFNYNKKCPVCSTKLENKCAIDILIEKPENGRLLASFIGTVFYSYKENFFVKKNITTHEYLGGKIHETIFENFPKCLDIKDDKIIFNVDEKNISNLITPWLINAVDPRLISECKRGRHSYKYESFMYGKEINVDEELLGIFDYSIYNIYDDWANNKPNCYTLIAFVNRPNEYNLEELKYKRKSEKLPLIPMSSWNASNAQSMAKQIEKYLILK